MARAQSVCLDGMIFHYCRHHAQPVARGSVVDRCHRAVCKFGVCEGMYGHDAEFIEPIYVLAAV